MLKGRLILILMLMHPIINLNLAEHVLDLKKHDRLGINDFKFETIKSEGRSYREKRDIDKEVAEDLVFSTTRLSFNAFEREFVIFLKRDLELVSNNIVIEVHYSADRIEHVNNHFTMNNFIGYVEGEPRSTVVCYLDRKHTSKEPLLYAQITLEHDVKKEYYYIEPSFNNTAEYIVYRSEDIDSNIMPNGVFNSVCKPKYANDFPIHTNLTRADTKKNVAKRQAKIIELKTKNEKEKKNRCSLYLVADYKFFTNIGLSNVKQTTAYLLNIIGAINTIYTNTVWKFGANALPEDSTNYGFTVNKVLVLAYEDNSTDHYNSASSSTDADKILQAFSKADYSAYCLAHLFTYQTFDHSVLGLAYVSSPLSYTIGGICSRQTFDYVNRPNSLNIGLSSYKSVSLRQGRLLQREAELVTAHEFGHNWGSEHDPFESACSPSSGSGGGNYIMYAYSNQGRDRNNDNFSPCSINSMSQVLLSKSKCFIEEQKSFCGNGRVEENEECDVGIDTRLDTDSCCNKFCRLRQKATCSDYNHNCCFQCQIARRGQKCWSSPNYLECFEDHSFCDGISHDCPIQAALSAGSDCKSYDFGKCDSTGHCLSICQQMGKSYMPCLCSKSEEKCRICCIHSNGNVTSECMPYKPNVESKFGHYNLSKGRPCFDGICNAETICEPRTKDYVTRFWKVIQTVTVSGFVEFMRRNIVGSIITVSLALWVPFSCCIHFCIDKRNKAIQKQRIQAIHKEMAINRMSNYNQNNAAKTSNMDVRDRLLIRTERPEINVDTYL